MSQNCHVRMTSSSSLTHQQKNILLPSSTHPCPRARLQSKDIILIHCKPCVASIQQLLHTESKRNTPLSFQASVAPPCSAFAHMHERERTLRHQSYIIVPMEHATKTQGFYTLVVCVTQPCSHLSQHGLCVVLYFCSHKKRRNHRHSNMTMPPLQQYQDIHPTCR